jgi:hypothetical protein
MAHDQEVVGSNTGTKYWMDVSDLLAITLKRKIENKGSQMGQTNKIRNHLNFVSKFVCFVFQPSTNKKR